jgi:PTS system galactitol-specific IIC component
MEAFFESLQNIISAMGASVLLPIVIFILGLVLGAKPGRAFRAGVTVGIAFIGIGLVIGLMWTSLSNVSQAIVTKTGIQLDAVDVGWPTAAAIAFGSSIGTFIIPISIIVNLVLLWAGLTRTLNVDVWNFWHFAFVGALVFVVTNNLVLGLAAAAVACALALFFADWTAKAIQQFYGIPGISITTASAQSFVPFVIPINWLLDRIPGVRDWKADPESIQKRFGVFGEPIIIGVVIGLVLGLIAYLPPGEGTTMTSAIISVLSTAMNLGAVMLLLPRMVQILMEGLIPLSESARDFMAKRAAGKEIYIGLDAAILIGHPSAIATGLLLVPITILLAIILPGNRMMPFADLAAIPFFVCMFAPLTRGNVVRMTILGTLSAIVGLYMASWMAPIQTAAARLSNVGIPEGATLITNMGDGWTASAFYLTFPATIGGAIVQWFWLLIFLVAIIVGFVFLNKNLERWSSLAGATRGD